MYLSSVVFVRYKYMAITFHTNAVQNNYIKAELHRNCFFTRHEGVWGNRGTNAFVLNLCTKWRSGLHLYRLTLRKEIYFYSRNKGLVGPRRRCGSFSGVLGLGRPACSLVTTPTTLPRLPVACSSL
jgi:hypothetical protein